MPSPRLSAWLYVRGRILLLACLAGLFLPLLAPLLRALVGESAPTFLWLLDLAVHWQWLYGLGLVLMAALLACRNRRWLLCLPALALPWLTASPAASEADTGEALNLAVANVHFSTRSTVRLQPWLEAEQADVLVLLEVSPALAKELRQLDAFPHQVVHAEDSPFGIALLSRHALHDARIVAGEDGIAHIEAGLVLGKQSVQLFAFHPMPPLSAADQHRRDRKLQQLIAAAGSRPAVLAGDLNASPWSSAMQALEGTGWRRASSLAPTWPHWGLGVVGIPIDQVLASSAWGVESRRVGAALGSDHLPLSVRLRLKASVPVVAGAN